MFLKRILLLCKPYSRHLLASVLALLVITAVNLAAPMLVRNLIDGLECQSLARGDLWCGAALLAGIYLLRAGMKFVTAQASHYASLRTVGDFQKKLYAHVQRLPRGFFQDQRTGELMNRFVRDADQIEELVSHVLPDFAANILTLLGAVAFMLAISPPLAIATFLTLVPVLACTFLYKNTGKKFDRMNAAYAEVTGALQENISGMREIQLCNRQGHELRKLGGLIDRSIAAAMGALNWLNSITPATEFFTALGQVVVICLGIYLAWQGSVTTGDIVGFLLYLGLFYAPVASSSRSLESFQRAISGARRVFEVLEEPVVLEDGWEDMAHCQGNVRFEGVSFAYDGEPVLQDVSFTASRGKLVAVAGPTGAGKSTMISLLARLFDPQAGRITIDGTDIQRITLQSLRRHISLVSQDVFLFNGTVAENIGYSVEGATMEEIERAARNANIHGFIESLPKGYQTVIGERGVKLSGGQRQRLAIARALLRDSAILVFDEATSSLDTQTEREIKEYISTLRRDHTILVIAHRLSTIIDADEILVLDGGVIVQQGSHEELLQRDGLYARLQAGA